MARRRGKKRKQKQQGSSSRGFPVGREPLPASVARILDQADERLRAGQTAQALALLEPLRETAPQVEDVWALLGQAYVFQERFAEAVQAFRRALRLAPQRTDVQGVLLGVYMRLGFRSLPWRLLQAMRQYPPPALPAGFSLDELERWFDEELTSIARQIGAPREQVERGLAAMEEGEIMLDLNDFERAAHFSRRAMRLLPHFPPPANNLALALFFLGRWQEAIEVEQEVLTYDPENVQALGNLTRFYRWTGQDEQAQALWSRLKAFDLQEFTLILKQVETAAIMEDDEAVYRFFQKARRMAKPSPLSTWPWDFYLAVAEANLGHRQAALRHLQALRRQDPRIERIAQALEAGQKGLGFTGRFHYAFWFELLPRPVTEFLESLAEQSTESLAAKQQRRARQMAARYPQVPLALHKLLWEEGGVDQAVGMARLFDAPETYRVLEAFALSQHGEDEVRMKVLLALGEAGFLPPGHKVRFWQKGAWQEVERHTLRVGEQEPDLTYGARVLGWLEQATQAQRAGDLEKARALYQRILEANPRVKEAYHNLAVIALEEGKTEASEALLRQTLEIDSDYLLARINLALLALKRGDPQPAKALTQTLAERTEFAPNELALWAYLQARLALHERHFADARKHIELALEVEPENPVFQSFVGHLEWVEVMEQILEHDRARAQQRRQRRRARLGTRQPTLEQAFALYPRDLLAGIGRLLDPKTKWHASRKAERLQRVSALLRRPEVLARQVADLDAEERRALRRVLEADGALDWDAFAQEFDHDWEEAENWMRERPKSVMGRLRARGLLVESEAEGRAWICIPVELREPLKRLLAAGEGPQEAQT